MGGWLIAEESMKAEELAKCRVEWEGSSKLFVSLAVEIIQPQH